MDDNYPYPPPPGQAEQLFNADGTMTQRMREWLVRVQAWENTKAETIADLQRQIDELRTT